MESGWLFQWVLSALSSETADVLFDVIMSLGGSNIRVDWGITYMVIIEEQHDQESERQGCKDPFCLQFPEVN